MNSIVPDLISGLAASISTEVGVDAEAIVENEFRAKLVEMMDSLKTNIAAASAGEVEVEDAGGGGGGGAAAAAAVEGEEGGSDDDLIEVAMVERSAETAADENVLNSVVKDVSPEEFRELDRAIHKLYCRFYADYSRLKEMRKMPEESSKEEMEATENDIANIQIEIEFLKHRVSQHKWPTELYVTPKDMLLKGEEKRVLRHPISEYQNSKVKEINRYIHKYNKRHAVASSASDNKAVEKILRDLSRFKKDRELTLIDVNMVSGMGAGGSEER